MKSIKNWVVLVAIGILTPSFFVPHQKVDGLEKCDGKIVITLQREGCLGMCPAYAAQIHADGEVVFIGQGNVKEIGERRSKISPEKLQELIKEFQRVDYFSLKDKYENEVMSTETPSTITSICLDGKKKTVVNYLGAPRKLDELEDKIERLAGLYPFIGPL